MKLLPTPDEAAAEAFLAEFRTRIVTQPLPYQYGSERSALESLWKLFDFARDTIKSHPGCARFAAVVTEMLNVHIRPVTARWDRANALGELDSSDGADLFRSDLTTLCDRLKRYAERFHQMAYGTPYIDREADAPMTDGDLKPLFDELEFGIALTDTGESWKIPPDINADEAAAVHKRRGIFKIETPEGKDAIGLALSGGGIRSATFALGAVQLLADKGLLESVDFLSTVSGGGYTGSFLTRRLGGSGDEPPVAEKEVAAAGGPDTPAVRHLRQNAKFLAAYNLKEGWTMVIATVAGMLLNWTVPLLILVAAAFLAKAVGAGGKWVPGWNDSLAGRLWVVEIVAMGGLTLAGLLAYGIDLHKGGLRIRKGERALCVLALALVVAIAGWVVQAGYWHFHAWIQAPGLKSGWLGIGGMALVAAPAVLRFLPVLRQPGVRKIALQILLIAAAAAVPLLGVLVFYILVEFGNLPALAILGVALAVVAWWVLDINRTSPHRLYRNGLAKTFVQTNADDPDLPLAEINPTGRAPYHLINAAVNLPGSQHPALRDRRCDFFLFSQKWTGSPATGYAQSAAWKNGTDPIDLATAMAISGAAVSSYMGLGSKQTLTSLLTFLNIRLGFWIKNPELPSPLGAHPGFTCLLREMTGVHMTEDRPWLNLSDGGHIENMAVYELLRRRCKFIVCIDGEADPAFAFEGLMTLVRHARIDFGIRIEPQLDRLRPSAERRLSNCHYHFCRIIYPALAGKPGGAGLLLYLKLSLTGNESELIRRYRLNHPDFPHQPTLDQFFDQEQFEAYRQLGAHAMQGLFSPSITGSATPPANIPAWFRSLAKNLLVP